MGWHARAARHSQTHSLCLCREACGSKLVEIVADKGRQLVLRFSDDTAEQLPVCMDISEAVDKLKASANCGMPLSTSESI